MVCHVTFTEKKIKAYRAAKYAPHNKHQNLNYIETPVEEESPFLQIKETKARIEELKTYVKNTSCSLTFFWNLEKYFPST